MPSIETLQLLTLIATVLGVFSVIAGFLIALWKTAEWFGGWKMELKQIGVRVQAGFADNDRAHAELRGEVKEIKERVSDHGERIASIEGR